MLPGATGPFPAEFASELSPKLPPFLRAHAFPLLAKLMAALLREAAEPLPRVADGFPLFQGKLPETMESLAQPLTVALRESLPLSELLFGFRLLVLIHL